MITYIALLRGINVGGHKKFPKADQLKMLEALHLTNPQLYIHTGNWVFQSDKSEQELEVINQREIEKEYGWEVPVIVLSVTKIKRVLRDFPFSEEKKEKSYFVILQRIPSEEQLKVLEDISYPNEEFIVGDQCIYFYPALGAGKAKLSNNFFENKLKVNATTRNFRTMAKLLELATA